jgi:hypothetical protein
MLAGHIPTAQEMTEVPRIIALGRRAANSTTTTTIVGVLRLDDIPVYAGRCYRIWAKPSIESTVAADTVNVTMRRSTDGSTPTTASTVLPGGSTYDRIHSANSNQTRQVATIYEPATDLTLSVLLCVARFAGSGTVMLYADATEELQLTIEDIGVAVGDTATEI